VEPKLLLRRIVTVSELEDEVAVDGGGVGDEAVGGGVGTTSDKSVVRRLLSKGPSPAETEDVNT